MGVDNEPAGEVLRAEGRYPLEPEAPAGAAGGQLPAHRAGHPRRPGVLALNDELKPKAVVHTAGQLSANAVGTLNLLEATRQSCPESPFVHLSTNKVIATSTRASR